MNLLNINFYLLNCQKSIHYFFQEVFYKKTSFE